MGLKAGDYVRVFNPFKTLLGTIMGSKVEYGFPKYLFHSDPRVDPVGDFYVSEGDVELRKREKE